MKPFPPYIFIPGVNPHPKKEGGYMFEQDEPVAPAIDLAHPEKSEFLLHSLNLYNHGYYWESHVYFEALWNAHGRTGSVADFLKGMIKLGAAGVKFQIQQPENAKVHLIRAKELFTDVMKDEGTQFLGFDLSQIIQNLDTSDKLPLIKPARA
jgi:hypothetical protein